MRGQLIQKIILFLAWEEEKASDRGRRERTKGNSMIKIGSGSAAGTARSPRKSSADQGEKTSLGKGQGHSRERRETSRIQLRAGQVEA